MSINGPFRGADVAVLVPTMNRPDKLAHLFESLAVQTEPVGRVIVVDGAENAEPVARGFGDRIPVEYFQCHPPGQLRQRNHGLSHLGPQDRLVALFDDDIVLEPNAVEQMVKFWNETDPRAAGVCFNIVNGPPERRPMVKVLLGLTAREPGRVLRSGQTTSVTHADRSMRVQWLPGGATVWRKEVLLDRPHLDVSARWAIAEDLIFSYPIGKTRPLYVCASARVRHEHVSDYGQRRQDRYHGRTQTIWTYHFVASNGDLSRLLFLWTLVARMAGKLGRALVRLELSSWEFALGQASALWAILRSGVTGGKASGLLHESGARRQHHRNAREQDA